MVDAYGRQFNIAATFLKIKAFHTNSKYDFSLINFKKNWAQDRKINIICNSHRPHFPKNYEGKKQLAKNI